MMAVIIVLAAYIANQWIIQPRKMIRLLAKRFRDQGYNVKVYPYVPWGWPEAQILLKYAKEKGDPFYPNKH